MLPPWRLADGQTVRVNTEAGSEDIELEVTDTARPGQVIMPHGFGLVHAGRTWRQRESPDKKQQQGPNRGDTAPQIRSLLREGGVMPSKWVAPR